MQADIDAVVEPVLEAVVFDLSNQLARRDFGAALAVLSKLLQLKTEPVFIVGAVGAQMRRLLAAKVLQAGHGTAGDLETVCKMSEGSAKITMSQARYFSEDFCKKAVELCCQADWQIKSSYDDENSILEMLVLRLSEAARHD